MNCQSFITQQENLVEQCEEIAKDALARKELIKVEESRILNQKYREQLIEEAEIDNALFVVITLTEDPYVAKLRLLIDNGDGNWGQEYVYDFVEKIQRDLGISISIAPWKYISSSTTVVADEYKTDL